MPTIQTMVGRIEVQLTAGNGRYVSKLLVRACQGKELPALRKVRLGHVQK
jgi:hypothetical protein